MQLDITGRMIKDTIKFLRTGYFLFSKLVKSNKDSCYSKQEERDRQYIEHSAFSDII